MSDELEMLKMFRQDPVLAGIMDNDPECKALVFGNKVHGTDITWIQATDKIMYMASPTTPVVMISYNDETGFTVMPLLLERNKEESDSE